MVHRSKQRKQKTVELLAPAGNLDKLKTAFFYGADAVYFGLPDFSLRARSNQFKPEDFLIAQKICRNLNKKFYITMNIYAHNVHLQKVEKQLLWLKKNKIHPQGLIVSDPGIIRLVKKHLPNVDLHLSTQANTTNKEAVRFWWEQGIKRIILARELTLPEIKEIHQAVPQMELEVFVHGAMCMSYSGRCLLSKWMTNRSANLGDCAQPCRWRWQETKNESGRPNLENLQKKEFIDDQQRFQMKVEEDRHGSYIFNSYDICLLEHLKELSQAGITSFKIEGRAKSVYYLAIVTRAYHLVLESLQKLKENKINSSEFQKIVAEQMKELSTISHRGYWTGFLFGNEPPHLFDQSYLPTDWEFVGISRKILDAQPSDFRQINSKTRQRTHPVFVHNKLSLTDQIQAIYPKNNEKVYLEKIIDPEKGVVQSAHGGLGKIFPVTFREPIPKIFLLRKQIKSQK